MKQHTAIKWRIRYEKYINLINKFVALYSLRFSPLFYSFTLILVMVAGWIGEFFRSIIWSDNTNYKSFKLAVPIANDFHVVWSVLAIFREVKRSIFQVINRVLMIWEKRPMPRINHDRGTWSIQFRTNSDVVLHTYFLKYSRDYRERDVNHIIPIKTKDGGADERPFLSNGGNDTNSDGPGKENVRV